MYSREHRFGKKAADSTTNQFAPRPFKVESTAQDDGNDNTVVQQKALPDYKKSCLLTNIEILRPGGYEPPLQPKLAIQPQREDAKESYEPQGVKSGGDFLTINRDVIQNKEQPTDYKTQTGISWVLGNSRGGTSQQPAPPLGIQTKLTIGQPGDKYEQEADRVAADVVQRINAPQSLNEPAQLQTKEEQSERIQRDIAPMIPKFSIFPPDVSSPPPPSRLQMKLSIREPGEEREPTFDQPIYTPVQPLIQRVNIGGMAASPDVEAGIQRARSGGQPLDDSIREPMEEAFGADFSGVRVHTDAQADQLNQSIQAKAFTTGQDVFFRQGEYELGSRGGQVLLAHELTHVVQQKNSTVQRIQRVTFTEEDLWSQINKEIRDWLLLIPSHEAITETGEVSKSQQWSIKLKTGVQQIFTSAKSLSDKDTDAGQIRDFIKAKICELQYSIITPILSNLVECAVRQNRGKSSDKITLQFLDGLIVAYAEKILLNREYYGQQTIEIMENFVSGAYSLIETIEIYIKTYKVSEDIMNEIVKKTLTETLKEAVKEDIKISDKEVNLQEEKQKIMQEIFQYKKQDIITAIMSNNIKLEDIFSDNGGYTLKLRQMLAESYFLDEEMLDNLLEDSHIKALLVLKSQGNIKEEDKLRIENWMLLNEEKIDPNPTYGTRFNILETIASVLKPYRNKIKQVFPDARLKFRGSLVRGLKGYPKGGVSIDTRVYDCDAFIEISTHDWLEMKKAGATVIKRNLETGKEDRVPIRKYEQLSDIQFDDQTLDKHKVAEWQNKLDLLKAIETDIKKDLEIHRQYIGDLPGYAINKENEVDFELFIRPINNIQDVYRIGNPYLLGQITTRGYQNLETSLPTTYIEEFEKRKDDESRPWLKEYVSQNEAYGKVLPDFQAVIGKHTWYIETEELFYWRIFKRRIDKVLKEKEMESTKFSRSELSVYKERLPEYEKKYQPGIQPLHDSPDKWLDLLGLKISKILKEIMTIKKEAYALQIYKPEEKKIYLVPDGQQKISVLLERLKQINDEEIKSIQLEQINDEEIKSIQHKTLNKELIKIITTLLETTYNKAVIKVGDIKQIPVDGKTIERLEKF